MKRYAIFLLLVLVFLGSCTDDKEDLSQLEMIYGVWEDQGIYDYTLTINGVPTHLSYSEIKFIFYEDGNFITKDEYFSFGVPQTGEWVFDESKQQIEFFHTLPSPFVIPKPDDTYIFEIQSLNETDMEVVYLNTVYPLQDTLEPVTIYKTRHFKKIE